MEVKYDRGETRYYKWFGANVRGVDNLRIVEC